MGDVVARRRDQGAHRLEKIDPVGKEEFEHIVEARAVAGVVLQQRLQAGQFSRGKHRAFGVVELVQGVEAVGLQGVDLAVVGQGAKRLGQLPQGLGVGGEALVKQDEGAGEVLIGQIGIEAAQVGRQHQTLVGNDPAGEGRDVKVPIRGQAVLHPLASQIEQRIEAPGGNQGRRHHEGLADVR